MIPCITGIKLQVLVCSCLYLGPILGGYGGSWSGPVIPKLRDLEQSPLPYLLTETQLALVGSFAYLGAIPGPYIMTWLSNTRGRKPCLIASALMALLGYTILATTKNLAMLYIGRLLKSIANGTINIVNFVYIGEIASPKIRGILLSIMGAMFTLGSILLYSTGPYISYQGTSYIPIALCILHLILLSWIPESPIFYALQGKEKELIKVLEDLGRSDDVENLIEMKKELAETSTKKEWMELFTVKSNRKALFVVIVVNAFQHGSGVMAVIFFSAAIFDMAGSPIDSNISMIIIGCCQLMGSTVTPFFIESTGRKRILIISSTICCLSMFVLGLYFYLDRNGNSVIDYIKWLPLVALVVFYVGYDFGLGIIPNAIIGEIFTTSVRTKGSTVAMTSSWFCGFIVTTAFGALLETIGGHVAFWFFSCVCAFSVFFTIFFVPETKGKTLLEIQEALSYEDDVFRSAKNNIIHKNKIPCITGIKLQVLVCSCLYLGPIVGGYGGSWSGPVIPKLRDLEQSPLPYLLTEAQLALVGSFNYLGAIPGPYIMTWLSNTRGRKPCLIASALIATAGYIILATTKNLTMLYLGRLLTSMATGSINVVNFVYIGEIASSKIRGILLSIIGAMFTVGSILIFSTGPYISYKETTYIGIALCILHLILLSWIPESPIYYALQGKDKELIHVLEDLGRSDDVDELMEMKKELAETTTKKEWMELFTVKCNRKALFIVIVVNALQHGSGVMAVLFFSAAIFDMAGSPIDSNISMIIIQCCQLVGSTFTPFFIESTGRKRILIISSAVCCLSMFLLGLYFYLDQNGNSVIDYIKWLPLVVLIVFYVGYDFGLGTIPNTIIGEIFTTSVRTKGSTLAMTSSWLCGFIVTTIFGSLLQIIGGHIAFWFFSGVCAFSVFFTKFFVPETKGKTLLEIQEALS